MTQEFIDYFKNYYCWRDGDNTLSEKPQNGGKYKKVKPEAIAIKYLDSYKVLNKTPPCTYEEIIDWITKSQPVKAQAAKPKVIIPNFGMVVSWIHEQINSGKCPYKISLRADSVICTANDVEFSSNDKKLVGWLNQRARDLDLRKVYTVGDISDGWNLYKDYKMSIAKFSVRESVSYDPSCTFVDEFLKYVYDYLQIEEDYDVYEVIFKHWFWCLKRRVFGKPVYWHIWINLFGAQGIGKSQMLLRMLKFMEDFVVVTNLSIMEDLGREYKKFTDNYVIIFDDLNNGDNSDTDIMLSDGAVDAIKQIMTQEIFTVRQYQTQDQIKANNTFVPISCANRHLYDIIYDGDAMRRWFEFNCRRTEPPKSYDELNAMLARFPEVLRGIDESNDKGYWDRLSDTGKKIVEIQKHYIPTITSTNTWIDYCGVTPDYDRKDSTAVLAPTYQQYCSYCKAVGKHMAGLQRVTMILGRLWPECIDDKGVAHVFIRNRIDDVNKELVLNDPSLLPPIKLRESSGVIDIAEELDDSYFNNLSSNTREATQEELKRRAINEFDGI